MEDHEVLTEERIEAFEQALSVREARMRQARLDLDVEEAEIVKGYETLALHKTRRANITGPCPCDSCGKREAVNG